jgi:hypothetical protein
MITDLGSLLINAKPRHLLLTENNRLNDENWQVAGVPLGDGNYWMYEDSKSQISLGEDSVTIDIPEFSRSHDAIQIFDNPKQLYLTKMGFQPGPKGVLAFSCWMRAKIINTNLKDYRDGFCAFNVLDFSTGMVFDIVSNGSQIWIIYERLLIPGLISEKEAFTNVIPIKWPASPDQILDCSVVYDQIENRVRYYLNQTLVHVADKIPIKISELYSGFGLITLHPIENGKSVSCRGQGGIGIWSRFEVRTA